MGLYSKAQKLIDLEREHGNPSGGFDNESVDGKTGPALQNDNREYDAEDVALLVKKVITATDREAQFHLVSLYLDDLIAGIDGKVRGNTPDPIHEAINLHITRCVKDIAHSFMIGGSLIVLVVHPSDPIDPELFVHQIFLSLKKAFSLKNDQQYTILRAHVRQYPGDGTDIGKLIEAIV